MPTYHLIRFASREEHRQAIPVFDDVPADRVVLPGHRMVVTGEHVKALQRANIPLRTRHSQQCQWPGHPRPFNPDVLTPFCHCGNAGSDRSQTHFPCADTPSSYRLSRSRRTVPRGQSQRTVTGRRWRRYCLNTSGALPSPPSCPSFKGSESSATRSNPHREPWKPNVHTYFLVYAAVHEASDRYFLALKQELEEALVEGVILIEPPGSDHPLTPTRRNLQ